jgi:putative heme-binding domain-containing protein
LIAYLRNMRNAAGIAAALGDSGRGKDVFEGKGGCLSCHSANGRGAHAAPDLSSIGTARSADLLQRIISDPTAALVPINRPVRAVTSDGTVVNGRRLNEDTFTVQLADERGRLVSFVKSDLREYTVLTTARMPSFKGKLTAAEVADLLSFLLTLKGSRP